MLAFGLAAYAVVGNGALHTIGTLIQSNRNLHWTILFVFAALVVALTFTYSWYVPDAASPWAPARLGAGYLAMDVQWFHVLPPLGLLLLNRFGIPVAAPFVLLAALPVHASISAMVQSVFVGYGLAFAAGLVLAFILSRTIEAWFARHEVGAFVPFGGIGGIGVGFFLLQHAVFHTLERADILWIGIGAAILFEVVATTLALRVSRALYWVTAKWAMTAYLLSVWLVQDIASVLVFLPPVLTAVQGFTAMLVIVLLLGVTFAERGGPIQKILAGKQRTTDIRSATILDLAFAIVLVGAACLAEIPMSATWVFLGLIAGREYGFALTGAGTRFADAFAGTLGDVAKAFFGLIVTINAVAGLPLLAQAATGQTLQWDEVFSGRAEAMLVAAANLLLLPLAALMFRRDRASLIIVFLCQAMAVAAFFQFGLGA